MCYCCVRERSRNRMMKFSGAVENVPISFMAFLITSLLVVTDTKSLSLSTNAKFMCVPSNNTILPRQMTLISKSWKMHSAHLNHLKEKSEIEWKHSSWKATRKMRNWLEMRCFLRWQAISQFWIEFLSFLPVVVIIIIICV